MIYQFPASGEQRCIEPDAAKSKGLANNHRTPATLDDLAQQGNLTMQGGGTTTVRSIRQRRMSSSNTLTDGLSNGPDVTIKYCRATGAVVWNGFAR